MTENSTRTRHWWAMALLGVICFAASQGTAHAQGYSLLNWSQCTSNAAPTTGCIAASRYGTIGTGTNSSIHNSTGALTIVDPASSVCGTPPSWASGKILDYNTSLGSGTSNQYIEVDFPSSPAISTEQEYAVLFCTNIPQNDPSFGGTFDPIVTTPIAGSQISNYTCNGTSCNVGLEACSSSPVHSCPNVPMATGVWRLATFHYPNGGLCADTTNLTDCVVYNLYDPANWSLIGQQYEATTGTATAPSYITLGNVNPNGGSAGHHVQFMNLEICQLGCDIRQFPLGANPPPWSGIVTSLRATDWSKSAGIPGNNSGTLPDSGWSQCSSTLAAGTYTGATITASLAGCGANTVYKLGAGTFNVTGQILLPSAGKVALRGSGSNSTFLVFTGAGSTCNQVASLICMKSSDGTFTTQPPANDCTWTAGFAQGATSVTLANRTGTCLTGISTSNPTILFFDACDTGYSGATCGTGSAVDNSQLYICGDKYAVTPTGCSTNGPDGGGSRTQRDQLEAHIATAVNTGTGAVTLDHGLIAANWAALNNKQVWIVQPATFLGLEDLSIDMSGQGTSTACFDGFSLYKYWVSGVRCLSANNRAFNCLQCVNGIVQKNYIYNVSGSPPSQYGIRWSATANNLIVSNILQQVLSPIFFDGASTGNVVAYNYIINDINPSNSMSPAITCHAGDYYDLVEGNAANQVSCDDVHGTGSMMTRFRNFLPGWESLPSSPVTGFTQGISDWAFARYNQNIADVLGTSGYHVAYNTSAATSIYGVGLGNGAVSPVVPADSLAKPSMLYWASYNTVTAANRFCGNALDTNFASAGNCNSISEAGAAASTFPAFVPVVGDTAAGQGALPCSFFYTDCVRPSWWPASIPIPAVGPDVSSGNIGQCSGSLNTVGQFNGTAALSNAQCGSHGFTSSAWGGHVNANPAMACALNTMGMPPDGSGSALAFDASTCFSGAAPPVGGPTMNGTFKATGVWN